MGRYLSLIFLTIFLQILTFSCCLGAPSFYSISHQSVIHHLTLSWKAKCEWSTEHSCTQSTFKAIHPMNESLAFKTLTEHETLIFSLVFSFTKYINYSTMSTFVEFISTSISCFDSESSSASLSILSFIF